MIVRTFEGLQALTTRRPLWGSSSSAVRLYDRNQCYGEIYRTQPNVRICVDFLSRNTAQIPLQVFRRVSDTDRVRLVDHDVARWLGKANGSTTRYRLVESLMGDLGIYFEAFLAKVRYLDGNSRDAIGLVRLPPEEMNVEGGLLPRQFVWTPEGAKEQYFKPSEIVYFNGYDPTNPLRGLSPLETLRRILAEEVAASENREAFWRNAARHEGVVTRPREMKRYSPEQLKDWREQWQAAYAGEGGKTVLLQDGETFTPTSFSAKDSEYIAGGKLRREVCAAQYHIPQPMVGILEHATFSNIREQHKNTYQDCLGPWHEMIIQELERQLLVESDDTADIYLEFNIDAKLAGTPEERASSIQISVGRPWRTVNEARALENLPRIDDEALDTVAPQQGGPSDASAQPGQQAQPGRRGLPPASGDGADDGEDARLVAPVLHATRQRQHLVLLKKPAAERPAAFMADLHRWNAELITDLTPIVGAVRAAQLALKANIRTFQQLLIQEAA